jgi:nitroreductase
MIELLKSRRSIRKYEPRAVEKEKVETLLKAALLSPSSKSRRPWEFVVVTDVELLRKLSKCREQGSEFLKDAPLGIIVIADEALCDVWIEDASITAIIMQLTAQSLDLGSCWIQVRERMHNSEVKSEEYIKSLLNIPSNYSVECIISVGYPAEEKKSYDDVNSIEKSSKIHYNTYGLKG